MSDIIEEDFQNPDKRIEGILLIVSKIISLYTNIKK